MYSTSQQDPKNLVQQSALYLRNQIKKSCTSQEWPVDPCNIDEEYSKVPTALLDFFELLLSGNTNDLSGRVKRLAHSYACDCIYGVSVGKHKTAKHILLPWAVKSLTGNVELVKILNRFGHGISYSQMEELDTALCLQKLEEEDEKGISLPSNINPGIPTVLAYDNIDRNEETLTGEGTSHRINGIAIQEKILGAPLPQEKRKVQKAKQRSIPFNPVVLPPYNAGDKTSPPVIKAVDVEFCNVAKEAWSKNMIWSLARQIDDTSQSVSSWTGFNILTRDKVEVSQNVIGYMPTINAPATQMSTVFEILNQILKIIEVLGLQEISCVLDQALYAKAAEIIWKHDKFQPIVLRMGAFHTVCNLLGIIGQRFEDAGLRDLAVESGIVAEGSITSVLSGKQYNRGVRLHKLLYEALLRLAWKGFYSWLEERQTPYRIHCGEMNRLITELREDTCQEEFQRVLQHPSTVFMLQLFNTFLDHLKTTNGKTSTLWMSYLRMVENVIGIIQASREGNWLMHLAFIHEMIPWCFAYDKQNYARYLSVYYSQMTRLQEDHPNMYNHFMSGGFSVQLSACNPFARIPVDQATEETVNKDTQTPGGTKGFSLKPGAITRFYATAEYRSAFLNKLRSMVQFDSSKLQHPDLGSSRIKRDETDVQTLLNLLETNRTNPFDYSEEIVSLSTGTTASPDISDDLLRAYTEGEKAYTEFKKRIESDPSQEKYPKFHDKLKRKNLKTFSSIKKQKKTKTSNQEIVLKADHRLFGRMVLVAKSRNLQMKEVLQHPLGPLPWALANCDGTPKKNKQERPC